MAQKTLHSSAITFIDYTDSRKLEVYIASNLPNFQTYNPNSTTNTYTPDWTTTNLVLTADIYLDSQDVTDSTTTVIEWYEQVGAEAETLIGSGITLTINTNKLSINPIITYICKAKYTDNGEKSPTALSKITFTRVDAGENGENGTGFSVKGTAASVTAVTDTDYYTITYGAGVVQSAQLGDAYLYNGDLYVCADSRNGEDYFVNVGRIQGPKGEDSKAIVLTGNSQVFKVSKSGVITPSTITVQATAINTSITNWTYSTNGGQNFLSTVPTGVSRNGNTVTITGSTITSNSIVIRASDGTYSDTYTVYKAIDGSDGTPGNPGTPASIAFLTNENISFSANSEGQVPLTTFTTSIVAYSGVTKVTPTLGSISGLPAGMTVSTPTTVLNEIILTFSVANNATLGSDASTSGTITIPIISPVSTNLKLNWSKINEGTSSYLHIAYADNETGTSGFSLTNSLNKLYIGQYTDSVETSSTAPSRYVWTKIKGDKGDDGRGIVSIVEHYAISSSNTTPPTTWQEGTVPLTDETQKYLWNYETITYTVGNPVDTEKRIIGTHGVSGTPGRGITSITNYYLATSASRDVTVSTSGWTTTIQSMTSTNKYLWNYEVINYNTGNPTTTTPSVIGIYGDKGEPGTPAALVDITPTAYYFKSTTGKDGTFTPEYIYLYPRFQNVSYSNWQYSTNGGSTWTSVSGANGLTVGTYSSAPNSLRIDRTSTLYTDTITSISFRCNSNNTSVYDTVSIAKIYDVVDLEIGGRNLITSKMLGAGATNTKEFTASEWASNFISIADTQAMLTEGETYTISFEMELTIKTSVPTVYALQSGLYLYSPTTANDVVFYNSSLRNVGDKTKITVTFICPPLSDQRFIIYTNRYTTNGANPIGMDTIKFTNLKLEKGNKATDWTPAPEDVDTAIETVNTRVTNSVAEIKNTTDSITSRVSQTETSIGTINNNVSSLTNRMSTAEQKITPTAIVSTVRSSTDYTNDLNKKVNSTEIISKINQTAESITISANKIGLLGATNIPDLTADKIKGGTLTLGGSSSTTQNGQILVKNASNEDMISVTQYGMAIADGSLTIIDRADFYDYGGWSSSSHTELKTTGIKAMYFAPNANGTWSAELDSITGLTLESVGGIGANPYYLNIGPGDSSDNVTQITFKDNLLLSNNGTTRVSISSTEVEVPSGDIVFSGVDLQQRFIFEDCGSVSSTVSLYKGSGSSSTVFGLWDATNNRNVYLYGTDGSFYIHRPVRIQPDANNTALFMSTDSMGTYIQSTAAYSRTQASAANMFITSTGTICRSTSSSERYKTEITDTINEELDPYKILDIPVRQYKYNEDNIPLDKTADDVYIGLIAEDVERVYPAAAEYTEDGQVEMWNIKVLFPALLKIVQDQQKEIETLKEQINNKVVNE